MAGRDLEQRAQPVHDPVRQRALIALDLVQVARREIDRPRHGDLTEAGSLPQGAQPGAGKQLGGARSRFAILANQSASVGSTTHNRILRPPQNFAMFALLNRERNRSIALATGRRHGMSEQQTIPKPKKSVALSGVTAGNTALCTVGRTGNDLHYRGYDILDIAEQCEFEEIAYLLVHERAADAGRTRRLQDEAASRCAACLPPCSSALEALPAAAHPMDVMRTGVSVLGCALPEKDDHNVAGARDIADRLMASLGSMLLYWYHFSHSGRRIEVETDDDIDRRTLPASAARHAPLEVVGRAMHASLNPLCRARVQRIDVHRPRDRRHGLGHVLGDHRRDRRAARPEARRRQRSRVRDPVALPDARTRRRPISAAASRKGSRDRLRPPVYTISDPRNVDDQGGGAQLSQRGRRHEACSTSPSGSRTVMWRNEEDVRRTSTGSAPCRIT